MSAFSTCVLSMWPGLVVHSR